MFACRSLDSMGKNETAKPIVNDRPSFCESERKEEVLKTRWKGRGRKRGIIWLEKSRREADLSLGDLWLWTLVANVDPWLPTNAGNNKQNQQLRYLRRSRRRLPANSFPLLHSLRFSVRVNRKPLVKSNAVVRLLNTQTIRDKSLERRNRLETGGIACSDKWEKFLFEILDLFDSFSRI